MLIEDKRLLQRFRSGDRDAMTAVFLHYSDAIARYLLHGFAFSSQGRQLRFDGLARRHELEDIVAETFRRAFEERARLAYSGLVPYESYLRNIARNIVIDRLRSKSASWITLEEQTDEDAQADSAPSPERVYQQRELKQILDSFLEHLTPLERRLVTLRYQDSLSQEDAGRHLKRSRGWVRATERQVRKQLLFHLKATGYY